MTTNNAVSDFLQLNIDDRLGVLALLYKQLASSIPASAIEGISDLSGADIVAHLTKLSPEEKLSALRDILPAEKTDQDEVILDANPSKALTELVKGGTTVPTGKYGALKPEAKLAVWYQLAGKLATSIPSDYQPPSKAQELFNSLKSMGSEDLVSFLQKVL